MALNPPEKYRCFDIENHPDYTCVGNAYLFPGIQSNRKLAVIISSNNGWDHVSVHVIQGKKDRIPTWYEMQYVKEMCWAPEDVVVQYHPANKDYVNNHRYTLHMWRSINMITPPKEMV